MFRKLTVEELHRPSAEDFRTHEKTSVTLVLDNIRSGLNVGTAFRTSDGFAFERIFLCGITAQPPHREILKTALGATDSVAWTYFDTTKQALEYLQAEGVAILVVEQIVGSTMLHELVLDTAKRYALVFGNEVNGVSEEALPFAVQCVEIPQYGSKHSLNVGVSIGMVGWEFFRQLRLNI